LKRWGGGKSRLRRRGGGVRKRVGVLGVVWRIRLTIIPVSITENTRYCTRHSHSKRGYPFTNFTTPRNSHLSICSRYFAWYCGISSVPYPHSHPSVLITQRKMRTSRCRNMPHRPIRSEVAMYTIQAFPSASFPPLPPGFRPFSQGQPRLHCVPLDSAPSIQNSCVCKTWKKNAQLGVKSKEPAGLSNRQ
jgi:hypothetical protein